MYLCVKRQTLWMSIVLNRVVSEENLAASVNAAFRDCSSSALICCICLVRPGNPEFNVALKKSEICANQLHIFSNRVDLFVAESSDWFLLTEPDGRWVCLLNRTVG